MNPMLSKLLKFLEEDLGQGDVTSESVIPEEMKVKSEIVSEDSGILAGLEECRTLLKHFRIKCRTRFNDGDGIKRGEVVLEMEGNARRILGLERVMLNFLMRMSGIATATHEMVKKCEKYGVIIAGTRKTTPGFRYFEKKAIAIGKGEPHRSGLDDFILIKDNHIALIGLERAMENAKNAKAKKIEIEVSSLEDAVRACELGVDIVMLDNLKPVEIGSIISELKKKGLRKKVKIELSGGITPENILEYAKTRPDIISLGYITTKARWLNMSMRVVG